MPYRATGQSQGFGQGAERSRGKIKTRAFIVVFVGNPIVVAGSG